MSIEVDPMGVYINSQKHSNTYIPISLCRRDIPKYVFFESWAGKKDYEIACK